MPTSNSKSAKLYKMKHLTNVEVVTNDPSGCTIMLDKANPLAIVLSSCHASQVRPRRGKGCPENCSLGYSRQRISYNDIFSIGLKMVGCKEMGEEVLKSIDSKVAAAASV